MSKYLEISRIQWDEESDIPIDSLIKFLTDAKSKGATLVLKDWAQGNYDQDADLFIARRKSTEAELLDIKISKAESELKGLKEKRRMVGD